MGFEVKIWTLSLGFGPEGWDVRFKGVGQTEEKRKEEEKFFLCVKA